MARFVRALFRAEVRAAAAAAALANRATAFGICWQGRTGRVDASKLLPGEAIAVDVTIAMWARLFHEVREVERVTLDAQDLGWVLSPDGRRIGRVVDINGDVLTQELDPDWLEHVPTELPPILAYAGRSAAEAEEALSCGGLPASGD